MVYVDNIHKENDRTQTTSWGKVFVIPKWNDFSHSLTGNVARIG